MRGDLAVSFSCDPASVRRLVREALAEIEALQVSNRLSGTQSQLDGTPGGWPHLAFRPLARVRTYTGYCGAVQDAGPSADEVATVRTLLQRAFETQQHENSYWHEQIMGGYQSRSYQTVRRAVLPVKLAPVERCLLSHIHHADLGCRLCLLLHECSCGTWTRCTSGSRRRAWRCCRRWTQHLRASRCSASSLTQSGTLLCA